MTKDQERTTFDLSLRICEKIATEEEIQQLNELMKNSSEARQIYLKVMDLHFDLDRMALTGALASSSDRCEPLLQKLDRIEKTPRKKTIMPLLLAIAAIITLSLTVFISSGIMGQNKFEAIIIENEGSDWLIGSTFKLNDNLILEDDQSVKLKFADNTMVELTGPISTSLEQSDQNGRLFSLNSSDNIKEAKPLLVNSGETTVQVSPTNKNLKTRFKVTESGNAYGIQFKENLTEVHVFKGQVTSKVENSEKPFSEVQKIHNLQAAGFTSKGLLKKWTEPDFKTFEVERPITGVRSTNKHVHWLETLPASLKQGKLESNESIYLIQEKKNVTLPNEIPVTFYDRLHRGNGGTASAYSTHIRMLPKGTKVDSYLLHYDPASKQYLDGDILFDRKIIAVIARTNQLNYSDKFFALDEVEYPNKTTAYRGLDDNRKDEEVDVLKFSKKPNSIGIRFNIETDTIDQIRILVESE